MIRYALTYNVFANTIRRKKNAKNSLLCCYVLVHIHICQCRFTALMDPQTRNLFLLFISSHFISIYDTWFWSRFVFLRIQTASDKINIHFGYYIITIIFWYFESILFYFVIKKDDSRSRQIPLSNYGTMYMKKVERKKR